MTKMIRKKDEDPQAVDAAVEYATEKACLGWDYDKVYDAFLAGVDWLKKTWRSKPEKEYYGG